jgi:probable phosphoglycerate mutase
MATRHLHVLRHGAADPFGELTDVGRRQAELIGERLSVLPVDAIWHSPLERAAHTAQILAKHLPGARVQDAPELVDHVPHVPDPVPPGWSGFFDGFDAEEAAAGERLATALTDRFAHSTETETHEVLVTHAYQVAWLVRDALDAPTDRWLSLVCGNASVTTIEYRDGLPPAILSFNDMGHLPPDLRWTGFGPAARP